MCLVGRVLVIVAVWEYQRDIANFCSVVDRGNSQKSVLDG